MPSFLYPAEDLDTPLPNIGDSAFIGGVFIGRVTGFQAEPNRTEVVVECEAVQVPLEGRSMGHPDEAEYRYTVASAVTIAYGRAPYATTEQLARYLGLSFQAAESALSNGSTAVSLALITIEPHRVRELGDQYDVPYEDLTAREDHLNIRRTVALAAIDRFHQDPEGPTVHWVAEVLGVTEDDARSVMGSLEGLIQALLFLPLGLVAALGRGLGALDDLPVEVIHTVQINTGVQYAARATVTTSQGRIFEAPYETVLPGGPFVVGSLVPGSFTAFPVQGFRPQETLDLRATKASEGSLPTIWDMLEES